MQHLECYKQRKKQKNTAIHTAAGIFIDWLTYYMQHADNTKIGVDMFEKRVKLLNYFFCFMPKIHNYDFYVCSVQFIFFSIFDMSSRHLS